MGALVTLDLPSDSPLSELPWIITFGPLGDDEWEPVVCGPYERPHALALAEALVADDELMAVVEPLIPAVSVDQIRGEIAAAQLAAADETVQVERADLYGDYEDTIDEEELAAEDDHVTGPLPVPDVTELRAGFARIAAQLTDG
ncbi:hypothetical protein C1A38_17320 [Verrucosispora sp. ts21]|uniref:hypothetical protein n=1 Tax=Verrucosispora sp. ts21 TaxID=2069341 RepID=UPI000C883D9A|nr:hypothetical protein [Verrucosispora sp. ts21]PMR59838.1 hypothetical protein C1A38_17320 [Verrucosispora sp. ts21]